MFIEDLNIDVMRIVMSHLDFKDLISFISTSKYFRTFLEDVAHRITFSTEMALKYPRIVRNLSTLKKLNYNIFPLLRNITFEKEFNEEVTLPQSLQSVTFGYDFNQEVSLPQGLQSVEFGEWFNQKVTLPQSLQSVEFGCEFNRSIKSN